MNQTLDEDGMFLPGPPEPGPSNVDANKDTLLKSNGEFESSQRSPDRKRLQNGGKNSIPNKRACMTDTTPQLWKRKFKVPSRQSRKSRCTPRRKRALKTRGIKCRSTSRQMRISKMISTATGQAKKELTTLIM